MVGFRPGDGRGLLSSGAQALLQVSSDKLHLLRGDVSILGHLGIASAGFAVGAGGVAWLSGMGRASGKDAPQECVGDAWQAPAPVPAGWAFLTPVLVAVMSIPALLGSWCWPLVLAVLLNAENLAHPVYREISHSLMFGFHAGLFGMLVLFMLLRLEPQKTPLKRWGPSILVMMGALCVLFDLTRHVLLDQNIAPMLLHMYNFDGSLTPIGRLGMVLTWVGTALVTVGLMWFLEYDKKVARFLQWIRAGDAGEGKSDV